MIKWNQIKLNNEELKKFLLKEIIYKKFLNNVIKFYLQQNPGEFDINRFNITIKSIETFGDIYSILSSAFSWKDSDEGFDYWNNIWNKAYKIKK